MVDIREKAQSLILAWKAAHTGHSVAGRLERLIGLGDRCALQIVQAFVRLLDELESVPVQFGDNATQVAPQQVDYSQIIEVGMLMLEQLAKGQSASTSILHDLLARRLVALKYRLERENGGWSRLQVDPILFVTIQDRARKWLDSYSAFTGSPIVAQQERSLWDVTRYPEFVKILLEDNQLLDSFFLWTLRDLMEVAPFVEFPALQEKVIRSYLSQRIGRFGGALLKVKIVRSTQGFEKVVVLPFEGTEVSVLDEQKTVSLRGNYTVTIKEVFLTFSSKLSQIGNLEFLSNGVINWNCHWLAYWDGSAQQYHQIDLNKPAWWRELPIMERLTLDEAQTRYGKHLDGVQWTLEVNATRTKINLDPDQSHAFLQIILPMQNDYYAVYAFGKFATTYAGSLFQSLSLFTATLHAAIGYPDENLFYTHRQTARYVIPITPKEGEGFMEAIKDDMIKSRLGLLTYQIESDNCAKWIQDMLEAQLGAQRVPDLFRIPMLDSTPPGPFLKMFELLRMLPEEYHSPVLSFLHYTVGAWRGKWVLEGGEKVWRSVTTTQFWKKKVIYLPARLHEQNKAGTLEG